MNQLIVCKTKFKNMSFYTCSLQVSGIILRKCLCCYLSYLVCKGCSESNQQLLAIGRGVGLESPLLNRWTQKVKVHFSTFYYNVFWKILKSWITTKILRCITLNKIQTYGHAVGYVKIIGLWSTHIFCQ